MANEVAVRSRTELAQGGDNPFAAAAQDMGGSNSAYAKFNGNSGEFTYGKNSEEVEVGELMAVNVAGARRGWICWKDGDVAEEIMVPIAQGNPPAEHTLTDHGPYTKHEDGTEDGWSKQFAVDIRLLGDRHGGAEIVYKTTTASAQRPLSDLVSQFAKDYKNHPGQIPIVEFGKGDYMPKNKKHGKKYFPKFKIVDWIDEDELLERYAATEEGDENDNLIADETAAKAAAEAKALADAKAAKDKKAAAAAEKKAKAEAATAKAAEVAEPAEEEDEDERLLREMQERIAAKKAAAEAAKAPASEPEVAESDAEKPKPSGGTRNRMRNF